MVCSYQIMGLFSSIAKAVTSTVKTVASIPSQVVTVYKGGDVKAGTGKVVTGIINAAATIGQSLNPLSSLKPTVNTNIVKSEPVKKVLETVVKHPYVSAAIVAAPIMAIKNPSAAASVVKSLVPASTTGKIAAVVAAPVVVGAVIQNPTGAFNTAASAPSNLVNFGGNISKVVSSPSIENVKELVTENPLLTAATAAAGGVVLSKGVTAAANIIATERNTRALETAANNVTSTAPVANTSVVPEQTTKTATAAATTPVMASTAPVYASTTTTSKRRKRRPIKAAVPSVRQNLSVIVQNRQNNVRISKTEKIIKKELLA